MRKTLLALSIFFTTISCSNEIDLLPDNNVNLNQGNVNILSQAGLVAYNRAIGKIFFDKLDSNKDGNVSLQEYQKMKINDLEKRFKRVDKDNNGLITVDEMMMNRKNFLPDIYSKDSLRAFAKDSFDKLDTDKNSILTYQEFSSMMSKENNELVATIFNFVDINKDSTLDISEFEDFMFAQMQTKANAEQI